MAGRYHFKKPISIEELRKASRRQWTPPSGRGNLILLDLSIGTVVERCYRHGGIRRRIFPRTFFKTSRPEREFEVHERLFRAGFPTLEPIGWRELPTRIPLFRQYAFYSRWLPGARTIPQVFVSNRLRPDHINQMAQAIVALFRKGIWHDDLNLNNWIMSEDRIYLLDFDKACRFEPRDPMRYLHAVFCRMGRSGRKLGFDHRRGRRALTRLMVRAAVGLDVDVGTLVRGVRRRLGNQRFYHRLAWILSGGHRGP